jgi:2-polyprenyl-6-methoxyphenol hydroxylase-like FAD-dependent oxidoreductase
VTSTVTAAETDVLIAGSGPAGAAAALFLTGILLVRPDLYVAARSAAAPESAEQASDWLRPALTRVLGT